MQLIKVLSVVACFAVLVHGEEVWKRLEQEWTKEDARHILSDSPWAKRVTFIQDTGTQITVVVRWETARPVQAALAIIGETPVAVSDPARTAVLVVTAQKERGTPPEYSDKWDRLEVVVNDGHAYERRIVELKDNFPAHVFAFARDQILAPEFRLPFASVDTRKVRLRLRLGDSKAVCSFSLSAMKFRGAPSL